MSSKTRLVEPATPGETMALGRKRYQQIDHDPYLGHLRVGAGVGYTHLGEPYLNAEEHVAMARRFAANRVDHGQMPECSLTGYSNGRYFNDQRLLRGAEEAAGDIAATLKGSYPGIFIFGLPMVIDGGLFNAGLALHVPSGKFLGASVKRFPPNNQQFNELKVFNYGAALTSKSTMFAGQRIPVGTRLVFRCTNIRNYIFGIPVCEDDWTIAKSSHHMAAWGATILSSLNGTDELIGKEEFRLDMIKMIAADAMAALIYNSNGPGESSYRQAYAGCQYIIENGNVREEVAPLSWVDTFGDPEVRGRSMVFHDIDLDHLAHDRMITNSYQMAAAETRRKYRFRVIDFTLDRGDEPRSLRTRTSAHPYVPKDREALRKVCAKIVRIKLAADLQRVAYVGPSDIWVAYSGGADSTTRLCDTRRVVKALKRPATDVHALTMPGFGTSSGSYDRVQGLTRALGVSLHEVDIKPVAFAIMKAMGHKPFGHDIANETLEDFISWLHGFVAECAAKKITPSDLTFENVQAHVRTLICTRYGFTFGTSDLSEAANAWCTWLADHIGGHYNSQQDQPKELVRAQLWYDAECGEFGEEASRYLIDTYNAIVSAELLPLGPNGELVQKTDEVNGPEEVRDFFLRYMRRYQDCPDKILALAQHVNRLELFNVQYTEEQLLGWYNRFAGRFIGMRYKPACHSDGAIKGSDSLANENWIVPSDACRTMLQLPDGFSLAPYWAAIDAQVPVPVAC